MRRFHRKSGRELVGSEGRARIFEEVTIILLGDHGMAGICDEKYVLTIQPPSGVSSAEIVQKMNEGLSSGKIGNGDMLRVYLKQDLPERFHYAERNRISAIVGLVEKGYTVEYKREKRMNAKGLMVPCVPYTNWYQSLASSFNGGRFRVFHTPHGYDNLLFSMRTFFVAHGPRFAKGKKIHGNPIFSSLVF
ncbi:hypothetical protein MA16_Dca011075 [Dendrobium catenatum]|uniref:Uncharacterized protein n=1 Tax=Dendrobium catenatum TaxID=906689 RepID=A0A2I0W3I7_9ASPA|nr:hypothetical protein MA16_Dca011075 [Dendrobium catenatum]